MKISVPVMWLETSEARKSASSATWSAVPGRFPVSGISPSGNSPMKMQKIELYQTAEQTMAVYEKSMLDN